MTITTKQIEKMLKDKHTMKLMDIMEDIRCDIRSKYREIADLNLKKIELEIKIRKKYKLNPIDMMNFSIGRAEALRKEAKNG